MHQNTLPDDARQDMEASCFVAFDLFVISFFILWIMEYSIYAEN